MKSITGIFDMKYAVYGAAQESYVSHSQVRAALDGCVTSSVPPPEGGVPNTLSLVSSAAGKFHLQCSVCGLHLQVNKRRDSSR